MTREEFEKLAEKYYRRLFKDAKKHGADDDDTANEIVQETLAGLSQAFPSFRGESDPYTWFHAVLRNKIRDHIAREMKRRQERTVARRYAWPYTRLEQRTVGAEGSPQGKLFSEMWHTASQLESGTPPKYENEMQGEDVDDGDDAQAENNEFDGELLEEASDDNSRAPGLCSVYNANLELVKLLDPREAWKKKEIARQQAKEGTIRRILSGISELIPTDQLPEEIDALEQRQAREALQTALNDVGIPKDIQKAMWRYAEGIPLSQLAKELDLPPDFLDYEVRKWFPKLRRTSLSRWRLRK